jgi:hypothetical protein
MQAAIDERRRLARDGKRALEPAEQPDYSPNDMEEESSEGHIQHPAYPRPHGAQNSLLPARLDEAATTSCGAEIKMPPQYGTFKEAQRVRMQGTEHPQLELG